MNICSDRQDTCIVGVSGVPCSHAKPHNKIKDCSHTRFHCGQFPDKQHRCKKFRPEKSNFKVFTGTDTILVVGVVLDPELLRLVGKYGTRCKGYSDESIRVSLPKWLMAAFMAGQINGTSN